MSEMASVPVSASVPIVVNTSAGLKAMTVFDMYAMIGSGTRKPFHTADSALPRTPPAITPAATSAAVEGTRATASVAANKLSESTTHAIDRG